MPAAALTQRSLVVLNDINVDGFINVLQCLNLLREFIFAQCVEEVARWVIEDPSIGPECTRWVKLMFQDHDKREKYTKMLKVLGVEVRLMDLKAPSLATMFDGSANYETPQGIVGKVLNSVGDFSYKVRRNINSNPAAWKRDCDARRAKMTVFTVEDLFKGHDKELRQFCQSTFHFGQFLCTKFVLTPLICWRFKRLARITAFFMQDLDVDTFEKDLNELFFPAEVKQLLADVKKRDVVLQRQRKTINGLEKEVGKLDEDKKAVQGELDENMEVIIQLKDKLKGFEEIGKIVKAAGGSEKLLEQMGERHLDPAERAKIYVNFVEAKNKKAQQALEDKVQDLTVESEQLAQQKNTLTVENSTLTEENKKLTEANKNLAEENKKLAEENKKLIEENEKLTADNHKLLEANKQITQGKQQKEMTLADLQKRVESLQIKEKVLIKERDDAVAQKATVERQVTELQKKMKAPPLTKKKRTTVSLVDGEEYAVEKLLNPYKVRVKELQLELKLAHFLLEEKEIFMQKELKISESQLMVKGEMIAYLRELIGPIPVDEDLQEHHHFGTTSATCDGPLSLEDYWEPGEEDLPPRGMKRARVVA